MSYLVDTNIISEIRKGVKCDPHVAAWYASIDAADIYLSVLVLGEIRKGIELVRRRNSQRADVLEEWLTAVKRAFAGRILAVDQEIADEWGRMSAGRPMPSVDVLLAATAKVHRLTFATRNARDVADLDVDVLDPFARRLGSA